MDHIWIIFVVGAGNIAENNHNHVGDVPADSLKYYWGGHILLGGFGLIEVNNEQMTFSFIEHTEKNIISNSIKTSNLIYNLFLFFF